MNELLNGIPWGVIAPILVLQLILRLFSERLLLLDDIFNNTITKLVEYLTFDYYVFYL